MGGSGDEPTARRPHFPGLSPIDAYGNGGFRFADMSHRGAILCLPSGIYAWNVAGPAAALTVEDFADVIAESQAVRFLILGTGATHDFPTAGVRRLFADADLGLDVMATGAAARTYNVLLAEDRAVAAALLPVP